MKLWPIGLLPSHWYPRSRGKAILAGVRIDQATRCGFETSNVLTASRYSRERPGLALNGHKSPDGYRCGGRIGYPRILNSEHEIPAGMHVFVDESMHDRGNFIVVAAVCSEDDVQEQVVEGLLACGFDPSRDEFKSSMTMLDNPAAQELRERLKHILCHCKIGLAICPIDERAILAAHLATLLSRVDAPQETYISAIYLDEGIKRTKAGMPPSAVVTYGCDSRSVAGIQLADCAAHLVATILLEELGIISKTVPASTVYDGQDGEIELAWTLWASIRYALSGRTPVGQVDEYGLPEPLMNPFGLIVSDRCSPAVKTAVEKRLGTVWIGCIH